MASRTRLDQSLNAFAGELLSFVQRASDSIYALKRTVEHRPAAGVQDFKECLEDLEQQVAEFTDEIQQLVGCTSDTTSLEELIGHCTAVYNSNRVTAVALEQHLTKYGYQQPAGAMQEPENPDELILDQSEIPEPLGAASLGRAGSSVGGLSYRLMDASGTVQRSHSMPTSPVSKSGSNTFKSAHMPSRLGKSQPGSPVAKLRAPVASFLWDSATGAPGTAMQSGCNYVSTAAGNAAPQTQQKQHERVSFGANSSTPPGLLIGPGVAALASKYATSSVGGSSVGAISLSDCQPSTGPTTKHTACRDLSLSYSAPDTNSPNLSIFGHTAANSSQQHGTIAAAAAGSAACDATAAAATPDQAIAAGQKSQGGDDDSTGNLYSSLIHSNLAAVSSRDVDMQDDQAAEPVTPPATSCPGTPKAPATAGRLPAEWHSKKMQELNNLQADLTITLSQMKRTPSRSRLAHLAAEDSDDEQDTKQAEQQQQQQQATDKCKHSDEDSTLQCATSNPAVAADVAGVDTGEELDDQLQRPLSANLQLLRQRLQEQRQKEQQQQQECEHVGPLHPPAAVAAGQAALPTPLDACMSSAPAAGAANQGTAAAAASAAVSAAAAAAAAATADLESWMESLSKKYAAAEQVLAPSSEVAPATGAADTESTPILHARENTISPDADALSGAVENSDSLVKKYAALAIDPADTQQHFMEDASGPPPPAPSCSPKQQQQHLLGAPEAVLLHSSAGAAAVAAAAAARSSALLCSVASDMSTVSDGTPGRPRLAAALAAGMAAFHSALRMDCPSPLSPDSPANARLRSSIMSSSSEAAAPAPALATLAEADAAADAAAELATPEGQASEQLESMVEIATAAADAGDEGSADVGTAVQQHPQSVLTPATQQAIRYAVAAVGVDSARPKSSIRHPQPTTDMKRLEDMRGYWQSLNQQPQQQQAQAGQQQHTEPPPSQQQRGLVMNLEEMLTGAADAETSEVVSQLQCKQAGAKKQASSTSSRRHQEQQQQGSKQPSALHSLRSSSSNGSNGGNSTRKSKPVPGLDLSVVQQQQQQQQLTPRAARLLRRQQQQQEQQQQQQQGRKLVGGILRSVENLTNSATAASGLGCGSKRGVASPTAAAAGRGSPATSASSGSARKQRSSPAAATGVLVKVKPVTEEEFSVLPGWCRGLLTVDVLNSALDELSGLAAGRVGTRSIVGCEGFTASDLEMLGHSSSKSKTIVSCLHKLSRATLQRSAAGSNVYKLVGTPAT